MTLLDRLQSPGPKRILALDGGGIRGAVTLGYLKRIETILRERHGNPNLRLCDYFDLIGGTSTGAIIAAALAIGMTADQIRDLYLDFGGKVFGSKRRVVGRLRAKFRVGPLKTELRRYFGDRGLGDSSIETGLCIVTKRADTGSVWPLINHPGGMFFDKNKNIPLRDAVRASTAAPTYFIPEELDVGDETGAFVDGGVSMANNPALQLFLIATLKGFPFHWPTGAHNLLVISAGTGYWNTRLSPGEVTDNRLWNWAAEVPSSLMDDASWQNQLILQYLSNTPTPWKIDLEVGDLSHDLLTPEPVLSYARFNVRLEEDELSDLGLGRLNQDLENLRDMSAAENRFDLAEIGEKSAERSVLPEHLPKEFDLA